MALAAEIGQHLAQAVGVAAQKRRNFRRQRVMDAKPLRARLDAQKLDDVLDRVAQVEAQILQDDLPRLDLGKVQDIVDEGQQGAPAASAPPRQIAVAPP